MAKPFACPKCKSPKVLRTAHTRVSSPSGKTARGWKCRECRATGMSVLDSVKNLPLYRDLVPFAAIVKGVIERGDGSVFYGSTLEYRKWFDEARRLGVVDYGPGQLEIATDRGRAWYEDKLWDLPTYRWASWGQVWDRRDRWLEGTGLESPV